MQVLSRWKSELARRIGADVAEASVDRQDFVEVGGRRLFYQEFGERVHPAVLFLHGAGARPEHLPVLLREIASRGFFVVGAEHPGMGRSEHLSAYAPKFFRQYALAYHEFLKKKRLREPIVIAQSFGGGIAAELATMRCDEAAAASADGDLSDFEAYRPSALVLVDSLIGEPPSQRGTRRLYGRLLANSEPMLRARSKSLRRFLSSFFTGAPPSWFRDDVEGNVRFAKELGRLFLKSTEGAPIVEVDYAEFILGGEKGKPVIFVWGEKDGNRLLDYGEWGSKTTALADARALHRRLAELVTARRSLPVSERLVRMSVIPGAGHAGLYTRSHMKIYVDELVQQLRESGVVT